jgi:hypothetical protein
MPHSIDELWKKISLTKPETAFLLAVDEGSIDYLHRTKQLRGLKVSGNLRWRPDDVRRFMAELRPDGEK